MGDLALGAVLRLLFLGTKSFFLDETTAVHLATLDWESFERLVTSYEANMGLPAV